MFSGIFLEIKGQENSKWERQFFLKEAREKINLEEYELAISILAELEIFYLQKIPIQVLLFHHHLTELILKFHPMLATL